MGSRVVQLFRVRDGAFLVHLPVLPQQLTLMLHSVSAPYALLEGHHQGSHRSQGLATPKVPPRRVSSSYHLSPCRGSPWSSPTCSSTPPKGCLTLGSNWRPPHHGRKLPSVAVATLEWSRGQPARCWLMRELSSCSPNAKALHC